MKKAISILLSLITLFSFCGCEKKKSKLELKDIKSPVEIYTKKQKAYLNDSYDNVSLYTDSSRDDIPQGVKFSWQWNDTEKVEEFIIKVSKTNDFEVAITERTKRNHIELYNFEPATKYYWYVTAIQGENEVKSDIKEFTTANGTTRFINCEGIKNMRDIGNYKTVDGKTVNIGLIYRCGQLNKLNTTDKLITQDGLITMRRLGIKTEIDLRTQETAVINRSYIENASYHLIPIRGSNDKNPANLFEKNSYELVKLMEILGNKDNYPMIIHCAGGADRTGFVCYTLEALLGMSKEDCIRDYLLTNFAVDATTSARVYSAIENDYISGYDNCKGSTLSEKVENHLLDLGAKKSDIDNFKSIMLK